MIYLVMSKKTIRHSCEDGIEKSITLAIAVCHHLACLVMLSGDPQGGFVYPFLNSCWILIILCGGTYIPQRLDKSLMAMLEIDIVWDTLYVRIQREGGTGDPKPAVDVSVHLQLGDAYRSNLFRKLFYMSQM